MTDTVIGEATGGKPINLGQLQTELATAGVDVSRGLGQADDRVYTYSVDGNPADFPSEARASVDQVIAEHVALRDKTDAEYAAEFQNPATTPARKQQIRDQMSGLEPREQVPM